MDKSSHISVIPDIKRSNIFSRNKEVDIDKRVDNENDIDIMNMEHEKTSEEATNKIKMGPFSNKNNIVIIAFVVIIIILILIIIYLVNQSDKRPALFNMWNKPQVEPPVNNQNHIKPKNLKPNNQNQQQQHQQQQQNHKQQPTKRELETVLKTLSTIPEEEAVVEIVETDTKPPKNKKTSKPDTDTDADIDDKMTNAFYTNLNKSMDDK